MQSVPHAAPKSLFDYPYKILNSSGRAEKGVVVVSSECSEMDNAKQQSPRDRSSLTNRSKNFAIRVGSTKLSNDEVTIDGTFL
jgi:hypothetical protein